MYYPREGLVDMIYAFLSQMFSKRTRNVVYKKSEQMMLIANKMVVAFSVVENPQKLELPSSAKSIPRVIHIFILIIFNNYKSCCRRLTLLVE